MRGERRVLQPAGALPLQVQGWIRGRRRSSVHGCGRVSQSGELRSQRLVHQHAGQLHMLLPGRLCGQQSVSGGMPGCGRVLVPECLRTRCHMYESRGQLSLRLPAGIRRRWTLGVRLRGSG